jgi:hypothetical protein
MAAFAALTAAQHLRVASAIRLRPAALISRFFAGGALALWNSAHRFFCVAAIRSRGAALITRFFRGTDALAKLRRNVAAVAPGMYRRKPSAEKVLTGYPFDSAEMHHRPSHCWTWPTVSAATSDRRSPQPRRTARIARSRRPLVVVASGAFSSACACRTESPMWTLPPVVFRDFTLDARVWHP